jgi:hypothetical protein
MGQTTIEWTASPRPDGTWASGYTKRIENLRRFSPWPDRLLPRNVWLGAACEDQERFDQRYPILSAARKPGYISSAMSRRSRRYLYGTLTRRPTGSSAAARAEPARGTWSRIGPVRCATNARSLRFPSS